MKTLYHQTIDALLKNHGKQAKIIHDVLKMHPFYIAYPLDDIELDASVEENHVLDLPFPEMFIEVKSLPPRLGGRGPMSLGVTERSPGRYTFWYFQEEKTGFDISWINNDQPNNPENRKKYVQALALTQWLLNNINKKHTFLAKEKEGRKKAIRKGKKKIYKDIKPITYVVTKKMYEEKPKSLGHNIDWSHKFEVRGHWRKVNSIGKDRNGEYCIPGFTWVTEHIRGEGELIKKTRIVKSETP